MVAFYILHIFAKYLINIDTKDIKIGQHFFFSIKSVVEIFGFKMW